MTPSQVLVPARPFHSINKYTIFITNDVMEHEKCSSLLFFLNRERQVCVDLFERFDFQHKIDHSTT